MRASRLLSILMHIQARGSATARELAEALEVSVRTVHRDIDELSASGVPIYAERGRIGGFRLLDGYRTRLTGLTPAEAEAVFLAGLKGPAAALGMRDAVAGAELKLLAALPAHLQDEAQRMSERFHLDPIGWFRRAGEHGGVMPALAQAVREQRIVRVQFKSSKGLSERALAPLGLVLKAGVWYLIAKSARGPVTYRVSNIPSAEITDEAFERPARFRLADFWSAWSTQYEASVYRGEAVVRVSPRGAERLSGLSAAAADAVARAPKRRDAQGWRRITIPIESIEYSARDLLRLGAECEVVEPAALRARIAAMAREVAALYA